MNTKTIKENTKGFIAGAVAATMLAAGITAFAAGKHEVTALRNEDITLVFRGTEAILKDATGARVYPLSYNGTTYVPIRAVSQLFGDAVGWDGDTQTVTVGSASDGGETSGDYYTIGNALPFTFPDYTYVNKTQSGKTRWTTHVESVVVKSAALNDKGEPVIKITVAGHLSDIENGGAGKIHIRMRYYDAYGSEISTVISDYDIAASRDGETATGDITLTAPKKTVKIGLDTGSVQTYIL